VEETCKLARNELAKVEARNQRYYNGRAREKKLKIGDSVLLLLPTERNKLTLAWRGLYKVVGIVGEGYYRIEMDNGKVKTYHINMLKRYFHRENKADSTAGDRNKSDEVDDEQVHQAASVACVIEDDEEAEGMTVNDAEILPLYNLKQKETVENVVVNPDLTAEQQTEVKQLLSEYREIFSDVPTVTHLIEHKVELTEKEPVRYIPYPVPYKMQEVIDKEIDDMLSMGVIEHSEAPYASPLALVKKPDGSYRVCVNFKKLNKITVFDPEPMMSPDDIFSKLS